MRTRDKQRADAKAAKAERHHAALLLVIRRTLAELDPDEFASLSNADLAARAGVSRRTLQRWLKSPVFVCAVQIARAAMRKERDRRTLADLQARLDAAIKQHRAQRAKTDSYLWRCYSTNGKQL